MVTAGLNHHNLARKALYCGGVTKVEDLKYGCSAMASVCRAIVGAQLESPNAKALDSGDGLMHGFQLHEGLLLIC